MSFVRTCSNLFEFHMFKPIDVRLAKIFEQMIIQTNESRTSDGRNFGIRKFGIRTWNVVPKSGGVLMNSSSEKSIGALSGPINYLGSLCQLLIPLHLSWIDQPAIHFLLGLRLIEAKCSTQGCQMDYFRNQKIAIWLNFGVDWKMLIYFTATCNISWTFGIFYDHLV
jgi:hypothetical protein